MKGRLDLKLWGGIGVSLLLLAFLFRKIDSHALLVALRQADYRLIAAAAGVMFVGYFFRAVRWKYLLLSRKRCSVANLFAAINIGYMGNNILPARLGEFMRAYALGRREEIPSAEVFATLVTERLWDGFTVLLILLFTLFTLHLPPEMEGVRQSMVAGGYATGAVYAVAVVFIVCLKRMPGPTLRLVAGMSSPLPHNLRRKIEELTSSFVAGISSSAGSNLVPTFFFSVVTWIFATLPIDLLLRSFGLELPITASMFILVFLVFAVMVPASPGFIGTYHLACVYALKAFAVPKEKALSIALVVHGVNFFPVIAVGLFFLWKDKMSLKGVVQETAPPEGGVGEGMR